MGGVNFFIMEKKAYFITVAAGLLLGAGIFLVIVLNYERGEAKRALILTKAKLEEVKEEAKYRSGKLEAQNAELSERAATLQLQTKRLELSLQDSRDSNIRLQDMVRNTKGKLFESTRQLEESRQQLLKLQPQLERLERENESLRGEIASREEQRLKKTGATEPKAKEDNREKLADLLKEYGIAGLLPKDYVTDYNGDEPFLQDCDSDLCAKIWSNITGIDHAANGDYKLAEKSFKEALSIDASFKPARMNLGLIYEKTKPAR